MKRILFLLGVIMSILITPSETEAAEMSCFLSYSEKGNLEPDDFERLPNKRRSGTQRIQCVISPEGVYVEGVSSASITLYEVYDENGEPLAEFSSESGFIDYVYASDSEVLEIRLHLDGYILRGYLYK